MTPDDSLRAFVSYVSKLKGDEKGEAQVFLEKLFEAFGHKSLVESGAELETRIRRDGRRPKFADLVWPGHVLIEMKARGERLNRHYLQVFEYWTYLVPNRPRFVVLCNFDEFWIYDFDKQVEEPMDKVLLEDLPRRNSALAFLRPQGDEPLFGVNRIAVTRAAADKVARVFNSLAARKVDREVAQRFVLQCVVAKFSEDLDLLPHSFFTRLLHDCLSARNPSAEAFDQLGGLFRQMNTPIAATGGRFKGVQYFNGGLFAHVDPVELTKEELAGLHDAALEDWSQVNPAIFGTIFQDSMGKEARHAAGAHFTSEADILKVVNPTIVRPWRERIGGAKTLDDFKHVHEELLRFRVLDPACGSGNFLYVAYRELKRIESDLLLALRERFSGKRARQVIGGSLSIRQFHGFDTLPFAVELAKVTLLLAKELGIAEAEDDLRAKTRDVAVEQWFDFEKALPLDNLDENVRRADALFTPWPEVDAIIGNPPFQSKNKMQEEFGRKYLNELRAMFPKVPGRADYCVYFFRRAHDHLKPGGRAGLVGTNTIRQNYSREGGLDHILAHGGEITEAVSSQMWSGDAVVHVSIVNWIKGTEKRRKNLSTQAEDGTWSVVQVDRINAALSVQMDVTQAKRLSASADGMFCEQGQTHGHDGFLLPIRDANELIRLEPRSREVVFPFLIADELLGELGGRPTRYVIDFHPRSIFEAQPYTTAFERVKQIVLPAREAAAQEEKRRNKEALDANPNARVNRHHANFLSKWWLLSYARAELMRVLARLPRMITCARVTKRPIFEFVSTSIHPNDALVVFPFDDDYSFGILQSALHWEWFKARCSTLKADFRYTSETVFNTFPWPQSPTAEAAKAVAESAVGLRRLRYDLMESYRWTLRDLYRIAEEPGTNPLRDAQDRLDLAVRTAYGMQKSEDPLAFVLELNGECAAREARGETIVGPGLPAFVRNPSAFVTEDCIRMD